MSDLILRSAACDVAVERQGTIAALQVTGSARELMRELTPEQLREGTVDPQTCQHVPGIMLLVQMLARRYAPLEQEQSTKATSGVLSFHRLRNETTDERLVRFDCS